MSLDWRDDFDPATGTVTPRDRTVLPPWDPTQLHFQLYQGRIGGTKQNIIDPSGVWGQARPGEWYGPGLVEFNAYGNVPGRLTVGPRTVFLTDSDDRPLYAAA